VRGKKPWRYFINHLIKLGMKNTTNGIAMPRFAKNVIMFGMLAAAAFGCKKNNPFILVEVHRYDQVNLVADQSSAGAAKTDANLLNAWGIAISPSGVFWISANHSSLSVIYDASGATLRPPVSIPAPGNPKGGGAPSGAVFNSTADFTIGLTGPVAKFIFATEDGTLAAWAGGSAAVIAVDRSSSSTVYKGLTIANNGGANFIYAADFHNGKIDVFDRTFAYVSGTGFNDPAIPAGFAPFNIRNIDGMLYVLYAKQKAPDAMDDQAGPGNGYVDIFKPDGTMVSRFASQGSLNSPWGIAKAPRGFGLGGDEILIGNFGDGRINVFEHDGTFEGPLLDLHRMPLAIDGLWDLAFPANGAPSGDPDRLFFTAGPVAESHGLFGYLKLH
jgi:uncharacterized protein (TIGR03118 family)